MKFMMIHGVNTNELDDPYGPWQIATTESLTAAHFTGLISADPKTNVVLYNDIFASNDGDPAVYATALSTGSTPK